MAGEVPVPSEDIRKLNVESTIEAKAIGQRIRRLRLKRSMGLTQLAKRVGLSSSFLSQLETGRAVPTLRNLARLAIVFNQDLAYFFHEDSTPSFRISKSKNRTPLPVGSIAAPYLISDSLEFLISTRNIVPVIADFLPHADPVAVEAERFEGVEFIYVVKGELTVTTDTQPQVLGTADVLWIAGDAERRYRCSGLQPARALIFAFPKPQKRKLMNTRQPILSIDSPHEQRCLDLDVSSV